MTTKRSIAVAFLFTLLVLPGFAARRVLHIVVPAHAEPESTITAVINGSTDAGHGEQLGFLQAEYSVDGGKTWVTICYDQNIGPEVTRSVPIKVGPASTTTIVRARVAYRGGAAGDVDYKGKPIDWEKSWSTWDSPPARIVSVEVK